MKKMAAGFALLFIMLLLAPVSLAKVKKPAKRSPYYYSTTRGATAECEDGTLYFGRHNKKACAVHGGVMQWFR